MSLLLQALQKAAKSREDSQGEQNGDALTVEEELTLEPIASEPALREDMPATGPTPAQAAAVLEAGRAPGFDAIEYAREHQMLVFLAAAVLFAIAYGTYVYIQVASPGLFQSSPEAAPLPSPIASVLPAAAGGATAQPPPAEKISGLPGGAAEARDGSAVSPESVSAAGAPIFDPPPTSSAAPAVAAQPVARPRAPDRDLVRSAAPSTPSTDRSVDADGMETVVISPNARQDIAVSRQPATTVPIDPTLMQAYEALQQGDYAQARGLYEQVWQADPRNIDALLGLAAIAGKSGEATQAKRYYQNVLELDPRNTYAQAGLLSIVGGADPMATESHIKLLIARDPSPLLYFTLGNLYAEQGQWPSAQQAYFQAYQLQSDNADYAFNLAVSLEHMGQTRPALDNYRKALDLSFRKGRANFDQNLVIQRVGQLSSRVEQ
jgi:Tfp pilus assembly protein PilF